MFELLAKIRAEQRTRWAQGDRVLVEEYFRRHPEVTADEETALDLICGEILLREEFGETPRPEEYTARFPQYADSLRGQFELHALLRAAPRGLSPLTVAGREGATPDTSCQPTEDTLPHPAASPGHAERELPAIPGYEILGRLDAGGWGVVYRARQLSLDRTVALKMLHPDVAGSAPDLLARVQREARAAAELKHPHIVQVYDFGEYNGRPYFTMEYVEGGSLKDRLAGGPLPPKEAARLIEKLARALDVVHGRGIVHRDLKPGNVLLTPAGEPKVADFGLAKRLDAERSLNPSGAIVGTIIYMAPEQAAGKNREVGPAADVWALGVILYQAVTGERPFPFTDLGDTLHRIRHREPQPPRRVCPALPRDLETICLKCVEKEPVRRYRSALELAEDCAAFAGDRPIKARPRRWYERVVRSARRHPVVLGLAVLLLLTAAASPFFLAPSDPDRPRREAEAALAAGMPYAFPADAPLPGPLRWAFGHGVLRQEGNRQGLRVETLDVGLLELVADPKTDRYRFSASVRHDAEAGKSWVGIYFGYREGARADGLRRVGYYTIRLAERGTGVEQQKGQPRSEVVLHGEMLLEQQDRGPRPFDVVLPGKKSFPRLGWQVRPWRRLVATVTPEGVEAAWQPAPGELEHIGSATPRKIAANFSFYHPGVPETAAIPADFLPRGGLGLYVRSGGALFRDILIEPLPEAK
jgi:predicted Ser/Thr protein kinase